MNWQSYKSGTDIRGVAVETEKATVTLTDTVIEQITAGFLLWLSQKSQKAVNELCIALGHDSRISAERISNAVIRSAKKYGCHVLFCGLSSTPSMFMINLDRPVDGAVQITASHHPYHLNGLKFFTRDGGLKGEDISSILGFCENNQSPVETNDGKLETINYLQDYAAFLRNEIAEGVGISEDKFPLQGLHIVVDAGNGAGGFYANQVLAPLGADVSGSVFLEPDGYFPNHIPNPEDKDAMASIQKAVLDNHADFGVIFDTDVDRAGCVDANGVEINRNRLVALASVLALEDCPGGVVVTDSVTSDGLKIFIEQVLRGEHYRYKRGYRNVIDKAIELCHQGKIAPLAIETSGHCAFKDNYFLDDGAYLINRIIIKLVQLRKQGSSLSQLLANLQEPIESMELRFNIKGEDFRTYGQSVLEKLEKFALSADGFTLASDNREGIRICADKQHGDGWLLLRLSVHDPVMPLNVESNQTGGCCRILQQVSGLLRSCPRLDCSVLKV